MKVINKLGQLAGKIEDGKVTEIMLWDLAKALKEYDGEGDIIEFLREKGFRVEE